MDVRSILSKQSIQEQVLMMINSSYVNTIIRLTVSVSVCGVTYRVRNWLTVDITRLVIEVPSIYGYDLQNNTSHLDEMSTTDGEVHTPYS